MFQKTPIAFFTGLNSSVSPELIKDNEARDILNFRMEKVGKLISRNGSVIGLFGDYDISQIWTDAGILTGIGGQYTSYFNSNGIIGLGELILESKWADIDTDRLMVYIIRLQKQGSYSGYTDEYVSGSYIDMNTRYASQEAYLFAPITGQYKNKILTAFFDGIPTSQGQRAEKPQYMSSEGSPVALYAPNKYLEGYPGYIGDVEQTYITRDQEDHWIKHYVTMNQYKDSLIISDMINGDMQLSDEYSRRGDDQSIRLPHELLLRPNALHDFDINSVELDNRFEHEQENAIDAGVVNGMALYKYELPKATTRATQDYFTPTLSDDGWLLRGQDPTRTLGEDIWPYVDSFMQSGYSSAFLQIANKLNGGIDADSDCYYKVNTIEQFVFTNELEATEYDDLLGKPQLSEEEIKNEDGKVVKEYSSNAFVWDDYELTYYPSNGVDQEGGYYLRDLDRIFTKFDANVPRILKLREHKNLERQLPLGVWKYRFVWDLGDEYYSAPSAEIVCPDIMWSAIKNDYMLEFDPQYYTRPRLLANEPDNVGDFKGQYTKRREPYMLTSHGDEVCTTSWNPANQQEWKVLSTPDIYYDTANKLQLTPFGRQYYNLKERLYGPLSHRFGVKNNYVDGYSGAAGHTELEDNWVYGGGPEESYLEKGDLTVDVTLFYPGNAMEMQGFIWEGAAVGTDTADAAPAGVRMAGTMGKLVAPIFRNLSDPIACHSVFDEAGRYRHAYLARVPEVRYHLLTRGYNPGIVAEDGVAPFMLTPIVPIRYGDSMLSDALKNKSDQSNVYVGIMCGDWELGTGQNAARYQGGDGWNQEDVVGMNPGIPILPLSELRPNTIVRAVKKEQDRLGYVYSDVVPEAVDRLVLQGRAKIPVIPGGAYVTFNREFAYDPREGLSDDDYLYNVYNPHPTGYGGDKYPNSLSYYGGIHSWVSGKSTVGFELTTYSSEFLSGVTNLEVTAYMEGERFLGIEQLTSYFPSSILFGAPRIGIKIPAAQVPDRAKRLLIFRTKSTHSNDYQPTVFGEVDIVDIQRVNGSVETKDVPGDDTYAGIYFFDDVKDVDLLYSHTPDQYEGLRKPLRSRFNIPINETVYYLNYIQETQPISPRGFHIGDSYPWEVAPPYTGPGYSGVVENTLSNLTVQIINAIPPLTDGTVRSVAMRILAGIVDEKNGGYWQDDLPLTVQYAIAYLDVADIKSQAMYSPQIRITSVNAGGAFSIGLYMMPSTFDSTVEKAQVFRSRGTDPKFYYIGEVEPEDEGIFVDDNLPDGDEMGFTTPFIRHYESSMAWSEPNNPDWLRVENTTTYREGDGEQITGAESLYGNIVIFKENSMHRVTVQAKNPPISRTDEISPEIGCIAPNALINVNNTLYFLSTKGLYRYDNNVLEAVDGPFNEELQYVMENADVEDLRDASMGYNPYYNELYLAMPMLRTNEPSLNGRQKDYGVADMYDYDRTLLGNIYVVNLGKGYATKFAYTGTTTSNQRTTLAKPGTSGDQYPRGYYIERSTPLQFIRKYYTNSLGELRSADIAPTAYGGYQTDDQVNDWPFWHAGAYIETPYKGSGYSGVMTDCDQAIDGDWLNRNITRNPGQGYNLRVQQTYQASGSIFPRFAQMPVHVAFKSKFFTGDDETIIKRIRKVLVNMFSKGPITLRGKSIPYEDYDERIDHQSLNLADETFNYNPSVGTPSPLTGAQRLGTSHSVLSFVPSAPSGVHQINEHDTTFDAVQGYLDYYGKPLRFSIEVEASEHTQLNEIAFWWRAIHTYLM